VPTTKSDIHQTKTRKKKSREYLQGGTCLRAGEGSREPALLLGVGPLLVAVGLHLDLLVLDAVVEVLQELLGQIRPAAPSLLLTAKIPHPCRGRCTQLDIGQKKNNRKGMCVCERETETEGIPLVDAAVILDEVLLLHLFLDLRVVQVRVQHDHRERQHVHRVCGA
jgi:hypothetical protein